MKIRENPDQIHLTAHSPLRLSGARGLLVRCSAGTIWITVEGETSDVFLSPGEEWQIPRNGLCLIESLDNGSIQLKKTGSAGWGKSLLGIAGRSQWRGAEPLSQTNPAASAPDWSV